MNSFLTSTEKNNNTFAIANKALLGSILAADGLVNDSITSLIPSMIISPIGSIIMKIAMTKTNHKYQLFLLAIILTLGILSGAAYTLLYKKLFPNKEFPTEEMKKRIDSSGLISNILVAAISSLSFNLAMKNTDNPSLIAIGIATSLLPPIVNIGCLLASGDMNPQHYVTTISIFSINFVILFLGIKLFTKGVSDFELLRNNIFILIMLFSIFIFLYNPNLDFGSNWKL